MSIRYLIVSLLIFSFSPPLAWAQLKCVASRCADGYQGCGCGPGSAECCRRRIQGNSGGGGASGIPNQVIQNQNMMNNMIWQNFQNSTKAYQQLQRLQQQKEAIRIQKNKQVLQQSTRNSKALREKFKNQQNATANDNLNKVDQNIKDIAESAVIKLKSMDEDSSASPNRESASKKLKVDSKSEKVASCSAKKKHFVCHTLTCGGGSEGSICCPNGRPYLNHCDCLCYPSTEHFECNSYSACQYEYSVD